MIEQQKRKGPELPLVPVKRQRHELLLGAAGSGPGAGQQQAAPGALLQAVSDGASGLRPPPRRPLPRALLLSAHCSVDREPTPGVKADGHCNSGPHPADTPHASQLDACFQGRDLPVRWR